MERSGSEYISGEKGGKGKLTASADRKHPLGRYPRRPDMFGILSSDNGRPAERREGCIDQFTMRHIPSRPAYLCTCCRLTGSLNTDSHEYIAFSLYWLVWFCSGIYEGNELVEYGLTEGKETNQSSSWKERYDYRWTYLLHDLLLVGFS